MQICKKCGKTKHLIDFYPSKTGTWSSCIGCVGPLPYDECPGCGNKKSKKANQCQKCYGDTLAAPDGTRFINDDGYAIIKSKNHPNANKGWIREHVLVMENSLERLLFSGEEVHHLNGVRDDNRLENLELWAVSQPRGQRIIDLVEWANHILSIYGQLELS